MSIQKELQKLFLGDSGEPLVERLRNASARNRERIRTETEERIRKAVEDESGKYLVRCLEQIVDAVNKGRYEVRTDSFFYWCADHYVQTTVEYSVIEAVIDALRKRDFTAYMCTNPNGGHGIHISWKEK